MRSLVLGLNGIQKAYGSGSLGVVLKMEYLKTDFSLFKKEIPKIIKPESKGRIKKEAQPKAAIEFKR
jgi:hypothetical protein